ncbi:MAG TPA: hypothetical protein ENH84_04465 [Phycisphaerae bacterium]|nr:hypothetical protein [Phycisphaerae bacterium]
MKCRTLLEAAEVTGGVEEGVKHRGGNLEWFARLDLFKRIAYELHPRSQEQGLDRSERPRVT